MEAVLAEKIVYLSLVKTQAASKKFKGEECIMM